MDDSENENANRPNRGKKDSGQNARNNGPSTSTGNLPPSRTYMNNRRPYHNQSYRTAFRDPVLGASEAHHSNFPTYNPHRRQNYMQQRPQAPRPLLQARSYFVPPQRENLRNQSNNTPQAFTDPRRRDRARSTSSDVPGGYLHDASVSSERGTTNKYRNNRPEKKFSSGERYQHRVGFKFLESILQIDNHDDALNEIMAKKKELFEYMHSPYSVDNCDKYVLLIKVLAKIYDSTFTQMKSELFLEIGKFKFIENLHLYFTTLSYQTEQERRRNRFFWNDPLSFWGDFLTFCECIYTLSPHFAFEKCRPLIDIVTTLCLPAITTKFNISLSDECLQRFDNLKKKFSAYEMQSIQTKGEAKHGDYGPVPENFRELEVFPGVEDLLQNKPFIRPNIIDGAYENVEHYLDVQFRLLREDCYGPLRIGIQQFRKDVSKRRYDNIRVYRKVQIIEPMLSNNQFGVLVQWDTSVKKHFMKIKWEQSKRLMFGSLLVFIRNNFRDFIIGTVLDRDVKFLSNGLVVVQLYNNDPCDKSLLEGTYSMLESQVYFEPYLHVLRALQDPEFSDHLAMQEYIVNVKHTPTPPAYLRTSATIEVDTTDGPVKFDLLDPAMWPECHELSLDESQYEAFKSALTQEFVVIQGPPGTGKTYVGAKIAKTILENFGTSILDKGKMLPIQPQEKLDENKLNNDSLLEQTESRGLACRLLLLCYTNHALDQFLEHILHTTDSIVRIGGQSRNRNLDQYNITQKRRVEKNSQTFIKVRLELEDANALLTTIQNNINIFNQGVYSYKTLSSLCEDVSALESYPGENSDPLMNWLFEYDGNDQIELNPENLVENENDTHMEDQAMFNFDDVGINEERRRFYEDSSSVRASFLVENETQMLRDLIRIYNDTKQNNAERDNAAQQINYRRRRLYLFQKITNNKDNLKRINIYSKRHVSQFTLEERWGVYFGWASRIKGGLLQEFQSVKKKQERKFLIYQEARMMMDLCILRRAKVVGVTTTGAARIRKLLQALRTPIVIVEEAAEVLEAHIISALTKHCQHLILIGDHQQLRPSAAHYKLARHYNLEVSLFERMVRTGASAAGLRLQHRMRPEIAALIAPDIYPDLQNHPSVLRYPPVSGLETSLYFLTHENREEYEEETLSRSNRFEADMMLRLANYIMQQEYSSEDVTILTTYASQMFYMKNNRSNYPLLKNVKITVVDKYQGEECRIILLSLVRNNTEGEVGFLATDNRVCVALSRAKEGMYIMGNINILKAKSELWTKIASTLESNKSLGTSILMKCQKHPMNITEIHSPEDFLKVPEGGCLNKCESMLGCGHGCPLLCHSYDRGHENVQCKEKCTRIRCTLEHLCPKTCFEVCGPCDVMMEKMLPCGHSKVIPCHIEAEDKSVRCLVECTVTLPACGHEAKKLCYKNLESVLCPVKCTERLNCGHTCRQNCHKNNDPDHINYLCKAPCAKTKSGCSMPFADGDDFKEHGCFKKCYEECEPCLVKVSKKRKTCTHKVMAECSVDVDSILCKKKCNRALPCKHFCKNQCYQPCTSKCVQMVKKVVSDCGHEVKVHCSTTLTRKDCLQNCKKILGCGHACVTKCFQECDCNKTTKISTPLLCGHTIVPCQIFLKGINNQDPVQVLRKCAAPCGAVLACGHPCAGTCGHCRQGRLHAPCTQPCGRSLICGHLCEVMCNKFCPPCNKQCEVACEHNRCPEKCGTPCVECKEPCGRVCPHGACPRKCGAPCARKPCDERCPLTLQCGHRCRGLCGELCPPLCDVCCPDDFPTPLLGDHYEDDDLFIVLKDCGHFMGVEEADMMMQSEPEGEVHVRSCPTCRKPIINTSRYKDIVNNLFKYEINPIKKKMYGDKKGIKEELHKTEIIVSEVIENSKAVLKPFNEVLRKNLKKVHDYLMESKKFSLPHINVLSIVADMFKVICGYLKEYSRMQLTELQNYFLDLEDILLSAITEHLAMISEQQQRDVNNEIKRMRCVLQLATITTGGTYRSAANTPAVKSAYAAAVDAVTTWRVFNEAGAVDALKKLETESKCSGIVTKEERDSVVRALGLAGGRWFKCPNGHFYCIGECGGAMERGRCPDCGATIGGANHTLDPGNRHAGEVDGSRHPAWSDAANLLNYRIDI